MAGPLLLPHIKAALERYLDIQQIMNQLTEEKKHLQEVLKTHLRGGQQSFVWSPVVDTQPVKVRYSREVQVEYDETLLQERLGQKYPLILAPDVTKIRRHLNEVAPLLEPLLPIIGTPDRTKVQEAVTGGSIEAAAFENAFEKRLVERVAVARRSGGAPA